MWGESIKKSSQKTPSILINEGINTFIGVVESIDDDGYSILRMGNSIILFFADGDAFDIGSIIEIQAKNIQMTSYD